MHKLEGRADAEFLKERENCISVNIFGGKDMSMKKGKYR
jgi:hypothetical protein